VQTEEKRVGSQPDPRGSVLLVDDDPTLTRILSRSLSGLGWQVEVAEDAESALSRLAVQGYDALVVDLQLPNSDGLALLEQMREQTPRRAMPAIVIISGHLDIPVTVRAVHAGASDVLEKPISGTYLDERLRAVMSQRNWQRPLQDAGDDAVERILGKTAVVQSVREQIRNVARFPELSVMIMGETGTGKELIAEAIHALSKNTGPFVSVNCGAIPEAMFERELFGLEADASSAKAAEVGLLESASGGTLFFDELSEVPGQLQPKLLRALEARAFRRLGGNTEIPFRARVISATNRRNNSAERAVRSDLYFRLASFTIQAPALRERGEDIEALSQHFLVQFSERYPDAPRTLTLGALETLRVYEWPGNIRELRAVLEQAAVRAQSSEIGAEEVAAVLRERRQDSEPVHSTAAFNPERVPTFPPLTRAPLRVFERQMIESAWQSSAHNLSAAARSLGLPRTTLRDKLRKYGLL